MKMEVGGIDAFNVTLDVWDKEMIALVNKELAGTALRTVGIARERLQPLEGDDAELTADITAVRASINFSHDKENLTASVFAGNTQKDHFAAYLEFGTGEHARKYLETIPIEYTFLAWQFFVNGEGTMKEHPFLIPTYIEQGKRLVEKLKGLRPTGFK
jgi:hypothetical protein